MGKSALKTKPIVDKIVAAKVAKAWALHKRLGPKGFEKITPPAKLSNKAKANKNPQFNPIESAEKLLKQMSVSFKLWLREDEEKLRISFKAFAKKPTDKTRFDHLNACIHTIKGNAPILGCDAAGMIASPLTDLLEGCTDHKKTVPILALSVSAMCNALTHNTPANNPALGETIKLLQNLNAQCLAEKPKPKSKSVTDVKEKPQAAGNANCSSCSSASSASQCPGACPKSSCNNS